MKFDGFVRWDNSAGDFVSMIVDKKREKAPVDESSANDAQMPARDCSDAQSASACAPEVA